MLDFIEQVPSTVSPPVLSPDTPIVSDSLPDTDPLFVQDIDPDIEDEFDDDGWDEDEFDDDGWDEADLLYRDDTIPWDENTDD